MNTDLTSKLPLREHIKNIRKILNLIAELDKTYFTHACVVHFINAIMPYLSLMLSAYVIDSLMIGQPFGEVFFCAAIVCIVIFLLHILATIVWNRLEVRREVIYRSYECIIEQKLLEMDFSKIDSPEIRKMRERIQKDNNWGAGILSIVWQYNQILHTIFGLIFAIIVGWQIIKYIILYRSFTVIIILAFMIAALIAGSFLMTHFGKRVNQYMMGEKTEEERLETAHGTWGLASGEGFSYQNGKDIRLYNGYSLLRYWTIERMCNEKNIKDLNETSFAQGKSSFCSYFPNGIIESGAYLIVSFFAIGGAFTVGNVIRFTGCLKGIFDGISSLINGLPMFALSARRQASTLEFLEVNDEMYKGSLPMEKRSDGQYQIEFKNVSFRYPGTERYALKNFSFKLNVGEKLAIVGMNGSGKTTMIKLLCRLYDPQEGEILVNGVDIKKFKHNEYSRLFSVVFQDYQLFSFVLAENVAVSSDYDKNKVIKCLKDAGFGERLNAIEKGVETYLYKDYDDGIEISGGEAQKIAIARAVYKDAPFILLDEPTSALDPLAEYEIYTSFDKIIGTKTAIYISHRLSSCRFCEKIAVFHEGQLVQLGNHDELVKDKTGKYFEMWNAQAQYYVSE